MRKPTAKPPNVLILMADELRFDLPGFSGNQICRTPNLDQLARDAVIFDNAYAASPVCVPGRQALAVGKYPFRAGCEEFGDDLDPGSPTFARAFSEAGYYSVAFGKLHHRGPDVMQGWLHRIGSECAVRWPETNANRGRDQIGRMKWRGAAEVAEAGPGVSPLALHDDLTVHGFQTWCKMHFGGMTRGPGDVPLLLKVSLQQPHFPLLADADLLDYYWDRVQPRLSEEPSSHPVLGDRALWPGVDVSFEEIRRATAAYFALVESVDQKFGAVIQSLEECGQDIDDWIVLFLADHGELLGEHACWEKRKFYEGSVRIPFFVRAPHRFSPGRRRQNINSVDVYPTLCAIAGIDVPYDLDGRDLGELLRDPRPAWANQTFSQMGRDAFMVKSGNLKYLAFGDGGPDVLFDLASDPGETANRIGELAYSGQVERLRGLLADLLVTPQGAQNNVTNFSQGT